MNAVSGFNQGTPARQGAVSAHERQLLAEVTRWSRIEARHFAGILLALDEGDLIVAGRNKGIGILEGAADLGSINGQRTVSALTSGK